jgi:ATP-dependent RNA helicase DOB1
LCSVLIYTDHKSPSQSQKGGQANAKVCKSTEVTKAFGELQEIAEKIATIMIESKIDIDKEEFVKKYKPDMIDMTLAWCSGAKFTEICKLSEEVYEGTIIRVFRRLEELLKQLTDTARIMGNDELIMKLEEASKNLKRGIVFAASLYL